MCSWVSKWGISWRNQRNRRSCWRLADLVEAWRLAIPCRDKVWCQMWIRLMKKWTSVDAAGSSFNMVWNGANLKTNFQPDQTNYITWQSVFYLIWFWTYLLSQIRPFSGPYLDIGPDRDQFPKSGPFRKHCKLHHEGYLGWCIHFAVHCCCKVFHIFASPHPVRAAVLENTLNYTNLNH